MIGKTLITFPPLIEGTLLKRYKRFLADIQLCNGQIITAHCPNTGPMKGVLFTGGRVRVRSVKSLTRKLSWTWEQAEVINEKSKISTWVGVNTALPNYIVRRAIECGCLDNDLGRICEINHEVPYGINGKSRIDLFLYPCAKNHDDRKIYLEVKNTTWKKGNTALFPDSITTRGQKHIKELINVLPKARAVLLPFISRTDIEVFAPGDSADKEYGELFRIALKEGVEVIPCSFGFYKNKITWEGVKPTKTRE